MQYIKDMVEQVGIVPAVYAVGERPTVSVFVDWLMRNGGRAELRDDPNMNVGVTGGYLGPYNVACGEAMARLDFRGPNNWGSTDLRVVISYFGYHYTECRYLEDCNRGSVEHEPECDSDSDDCGCECYCDYCEGDNKCLTHNLYH